MTTDQKNGAGAYKADRKDAAHQGRDFKPPFHLHLGRDRSVQLGYREAAVAAGAVGLGFLAFKGASALIGKANRKAATAAGHTGHLEPVPLAQSATPAVKDNAAPRFPSDVDNRVDEPPFVAASTQDDTGDLVVEAVEVEVAVVAPADTSARTPEHVPTDLMGDRPPTANDRAIDAFRPDPTASVPSEMRDSLRPATGPAPSLTADRGTFGQGLSQTDGSK